MHSPRRPKAPSSSTEARMPDTPFLNDNAASRRGLQQEDPSARRGQDALAEVCYHAPLQCHDTEKSKPL